MDVDPVETANDCADDPVAARDRYYDLTMEAVGIRRRWRPGRWQSGHPR